MYLYALSDIESLTVSTLRFNYVYLYSPLDLILLSPNSLAVGEPRSPQGHVPLYDA